MEKISNRWNSRGVFREIEKKSQGANERKWKISGNFKAKSIENPGGVNLNN